jgi:hypothetical protein
MFGHLATFSIPSPTTACPSEAFREFRIISIVFRVAVTPLLKIISIPEFTLLEAFFVSFKIVSER